MKYNNGSIKSFEYAKSTLSHIANMNLDVASAGIYIPRYDIYIYHTSVEYDTTILPQLFPKASSISTPKTTSSSSPSTKTLHSSSEEPSTQILTHSPMAPGSLPLKSTPLELAISVHASTMTTLYYT